MSEIQKALTLQGNFILNHLNSSRLTDISRALLDYQPNIVHYAGHSLDTGELCFKNDLNKMQPVEPDVLADLFELVSDQTNCVLLNSRYSKIQAEAIVKHISYVIAMNQSIGDKASIAFATAFYKAIGSGYSVDKAFKYGCIEIRLEGISEYQTPELLTRVKSTKSKEDPKVQWELKLEGTLTNENKKKAETIINELSQILGDSSLKMKKVERGSIKLSLESSAEALEIIMELVKSGRLTKLSDIQIMGVKSSDFEVSVLQQSQELNFSQCIFISHSHSERKFADKLVNFLLAALKLEEEKIFCTSNPDQGLSYSSSSIPDQLKKKLKISEALIILITLDSLQSAWIPFEAGSFWTTDKPIIPILGPGLTHNDLPGPLRSLLSIPIEAHDLQDRLNNAIDQLASSLKIEQRFTRRRNNTLEEFSEYFKAWESQFSDSDVSVRTS